MKTKVKLLVLSVIISSLIALTTAQSRYRNQRASSNRNRYSGNNEPIEQGRTLGLLGPVVGLGLSTLARPFLPFDEPIAPPPPNRPSSSGQSDPYYGGDYNGYGGYGGYGGYRPSYYGGYRPSYYGGYNYYGGYPAYRPYNNYYGYGGYRPQTYPNYYGGGGYPQYNNYGSQQPLYSNSRPSPIAQRPTSTASQSSLSATSNPAPVRPSAVTGTGSPSGTGSLNSAQASQVANLLGQLLGSQLRPLLNQGAASPAAVASDVPGDAPSTYEDKRYRDRTYLG